MKRKRNKVQMIGKKFGMLTAITEVPSRSDNREAWYLFRCDCGVEKEISGQLVRSGRTRSCGCLQKKRVVEANLTHGHTTGHKYTPTYQSWQAMIARCTNPKHNQYKNYGGRGIAICDRWLDSFEDFLVDMGSRPSGTTIERLDGDGNYEPGNCKWATGGEQARNKKTNIRITHEGETMILLDWANRCGIKASILTHRLKVQKLTFNEAVSRPVRKPKDKRGKYVKKSVR